LPAHDWTRVEAGIFHAFHTAWIAEIQRVLNAGLLPEGYYALAEQHAGTYIADVLTLDVGRPQEVPPFSGRGGTAVADAPPRVRHKLVAPSAAIERRRTLAIRHVSAHRLIALIEIVSPAKQDRQEHVVEFAAKAVAALDLGIHVLMVDLFPPGSADPHGLHHEIWQRVQGSIEIYRLPADEPLTIAAYSAAAEITAYLEHFAVGASLPTMPLFLSGDRYVDVPIESSYTSAFQSLPTFWRSVLED